jgi:GTPase SAR1 family protein
MTDKRPLLGAEKQYHYKVVIVGDSFTGKSSLLSRLSDKEFERAYAPTIGVDYVRLPPPSPTPLPPR